MPTDISNQLYMGHADSSELAQIILHHFGRGSHGGTRRPRYFNENNEAAYIEFQYGNHGNLLKIVAETGIARSEIRGLSQQVREKLIENQSEKVGQQVAFSSNAPIRGYYRYHDLFQINPALRLPTDTHPLQFPFLFQYRYVGSSDLLVSVRRQQRAATEALRYLNIIVEGVIEPPPRYTTQLWVYSDDATSSAWKQTGYVPLDPMPETADFAQFDSSKRIDVASANDYYGRGSGPGMDMLLPDATTRILDKIYALDSGMRDKLDRSLVWFKAAHDVYSGSSSSSFNALVTSIECLMPTQNQACECCGQPIHALGKRFLAFLRDFAQPSPEAKAEIERLYKRYYPMRSDLAHGSALLESDLKPWDFMSEKSTEESSVGHSLRDAVKIAVINWILRQ